MDFGLDNEPLVRGQPSNNFGHLFVSVDPEALVLGYACQLHILAVQLLLHDLLQCLECEYLGFGQGKRLVELVLEFCLCTLGSGTDGFGVVAVECTRGLGVVSETVSVLTTHVTTSVRNIQTRAILVIARNQEGNTKRPTHDALLTLSTLTEPQRQIAYRLGAALDS
mgnify:CR=1 FL=1